MLVFALLGPIAPAPSGDGTPLGEAAVPGILGVVGAERHDENQPVLFGGVVFFDGVVAKAVATPAPAGLLTGEP